jgi:hypothetical protein
MANSPCLWANFTSVGIQIPASGPGTGATLRQLLADAGFACPAMPGGRVQFVVCAKQPNSATDRNPFNVASPRPGQEIAASDFTSHGLRVAAGVEWAPLLDSVDQVHLISASTGAIPALVAVYW